jgi:hypothetical protein
MDCKRPSATTAAKRSDKRERRPGSVVQRLPRHPNNTTRHVDPTKKKKKARSINAHRKTREYRFYRRQDDMDVVTQLCKANSCCNSFVTWNCSIADQSNANNYHTL